MNSEKLLDKHSSRVIIDSFRQGTAPQLGLQYITVGRNFWLEGIKKDYLNDYINNGGSAVRFVNGDYGAGKSHFLNLIREEGFKHDYVVSLVTLKAREAPFSKFEIIYQKIISGISVNGNQEGDALKWILDSWYKTTYEEIENKIGDRIVNEPKIKSEMREKLNELNNINGINNDFRGAIKSYYHNMLEAKSDRDEKNNVIIGWIKGQEIDKRELKKFQIYSHIGKQNSKDMLKSLVRLITFFGYGGLIMLLDEAESISVLMRAKDKDVALDNIRELMDNTDGRGPGGINNCFLIFATTSTFFGNDGIRKYPALYSRVKNELELKTSRKNQRGAIIDLEADPLTPENMLELSKKIRNIHSLAFNWNPDEIITDEVLEAYTNSISKKIQSSEMSRPRILVKTITNILDLSEQYGTSFDPINDVNEMIEDQIIDLRKLRDDSEFEM